MSIPNLVESQLTNLHRTSERNQVFSKLLPISIGLLAVCIIPYLHIGKFQIFLLVVFICKKTLIKNHTI